MTSPASSSSSSSSLSSSPRTVLVTGASGHLGRRVVELLLARGDVRVVAGTRSPDKIDDLKQRGAVVRALDFDDGASVAAAVAGVERVLLISTDALDEPGKRARQHKAALEVLAKSMVSHVVYTSLIAPDVSSPIGLAFDHRETEAALAASRLSYTVLRNNLYTENLLGALPEAVASGTLTAAAADAGATYVTREDCARAAAAALASDFTGRRTLDITGPAVVRHEELARIASGLSGKPVRYVAVSDRALRDGLASAGLPPVIIELLAGFDAAIAEGRLAVQSSAVLELTGTEPMSTAEFLRTALPAALAPPARAA